MKGQTKKLHYCAKCGDIAIVALNKSWFCLPCFDKALGELTKPLKDARL